MSPTDSASRASTSPDFHPIIDEACRRAVDRPGAVAEVAAAEVDRLAPLASAGERAELIRAVIARLDGLDALQQHLDDPAVDEVMVNRGGEVWVERHSQLVDAGRIPAATVDTILERILAPLGKRVDRTTPIVDARLPDGSRLCAVVAPVAVGGTALAIRRHRSHRVPLAAFAGAEVAGLLTEVLEQRCNVVISGATSTGKTTLLSTMLALTEPTERLVILEDTTEIVVGDRHAVRLEARPGSPDQPTAIDLAELVRTALRLRPSRLVLGEFRGDEVRAVVEALNTGHDGSLATCHANTAVDAIHRAETLLMRAAPTWPLAAIRRQLTRSIDVVVHLRRLPSGERRIDEIAEVVESDGEPMVRPLAHAGRVVAELRRGRR